MIALLIGFILAAYLLSFFQKQKFALLLIPVLFIYSISLPAIALAISATFLLSKRILLLLLFLGLSLFISYSGIVAFAGWEIALISLFLIIREESTKAANIFLLFTQFGSAFLLIFVLGNIYGANTYSFVYGFLFFEQALFPLQLWQLLVYREVDWKVIALSSALFSKLPAILLSTASSDFLYFLFASAILGFIAADFLKEEKGTIALLSSSSAALMDLLFVFSHGNYVIFAFTLVSLALASSFFGKKKHGEYNALIYQGIPGSPVFPSFILAFSALSNSIYFWLILLTLGIEAIPISKLFWQLERRGYGSSDAKLLLAISILSLFFLV
jgi:hypothetical protein